ncbi:MAG: NAD(P)-dependent oxidoreductase [Deltaproteobacteria bacterium]|nr:NAD(P)-dependent oxidoreductase [Deltaproteobacteria bacterium]
MTIRVGFIGLGNQGKPIAAHLAPRGLATTVYDIAPGPVAELVAGGAKAAKSPKEVGQNADVVGICVAEDEHVLAVTLGDDGLLAALAPGSLVLIHSTVLPQTVERVAEAASGRGIEILDACVTGGADRAAARRLVYMVGGSEAGLAKAMPYFEATTDVAPIHAGPLGCGAKLKLCNNLNTNILFAAAQEATNLARASGLSPELLEQVCRANGQFTDMTLAYLKGKKQPEAVLSSEAYQRFSTSMAALAEKDLAWALALARKSDVSLPLTALVSQLAAGIYGVRNTNRK